MCSLCAYVCMCTAYVHESSAWASYLVCMSLCVYSCVFWSGFGSPDLGWQSLSTFQRSSILVLVLAQYSHWVTQWEVYLPACGRRHRNLTLWRWFKEKLSVSVTLGFGVSLVFFHTCSPYDSRGNYLCVSLAPRKHRGTFTSWRPGSVCLQRSRISASLVFLTSRCTILRGRARLQKRWLG